MQNSYFVSAASLQITLVHECSSRMQDAVYLYFYTGLETAAGVLFQPWARLCVKPSLFREEQTSCWCSEGCQKPPQWRVAHQDETGPAVSAVQRFLCFPSTWRAKRRRRTATAHDMIMIRGDQTDKCWGLYLKTVPNTYKWIVYWKQELQHVITFQR